MQVGMARKSLPPVQGVVGSILGHDILRKAIGGASGPYKIVFDRWYQNRHLCVCKLSWKATPFGDRFAA